MDPVRIGNFIKQLRQEHHLTQKQLAEQLGVTYQAVSKWENGKNIPDILILKKISVLYKIDIKELLDGEKSEKQKKRSSKKSKYLVFVFGMLLLFILYESFIPHKNNNNFEFKTMTTTCEEFNIKGSAAYNHDKTSIYISEVDYCGTPNDTIYQEIECTLYEDYKNTKTKIGSCGMSKEPKDLDAFLDTVELNVNNYVASCKMFASSTLYLEIQALAQENQRITYIVPINLEENCTDS